MSPMPLSRRTRVLLSCWAAAVLAACGGSERDATAAEEPVSVAPSPAPGSAPSPAESTATLQWSAAGDPRVVAYRVYSGTAPRSYQQARGSGVEVGTSSTYVFGGLQRGQTYYFAVTAYDAAGNESDFSAEASKTLP